MHRLQTIVQLSVVKGNFLKIFFNPSLLAPKRNRDLKGDLDCLNLIQIINFTQKINKKQLCSKKELIGYTNWTLGKKYHSEKRLCCYTCNLFLPEVSEPVHPSETVLNVSTSCIKVSENFTVPL